MKRKMRFCVLAFVMAIVMAVVSPAQVIATVTNKQYIKEIRIGYGESGKDQLTNAGYKILYDTSSNIVNANEGGAGEAVYLGYITTSLKEEAITDVAVMPMGADGDRAYSFEAYKTEMKNLEAQIKEKVQNFGSAILEFRENYQKEEPYNQYAEKARAMLNKFTEDDTLKEVTTTDENGKKVTNKVPSGIGDLLLDSQYVVYPGPTYSNNYNPPEVYRNILMMGNATAVQSITTALVLGVTETEGETFLDRIADAKYTTRLTASRNVARSTLSGVLEEFRNTLLLAKDTYETAMAYEGGKEAYVQQFLNADQTSNSASYNEVLQQLTLVEIMQDIPYGNCQDDDKNQLSFLDAMLLPLNYGEGSDLVLTDQMIDILAKSMTTGQIAISQYSGLAPLIFNAYNSANENVKDENGKTTSASEIIDSYIEMLDPGQTISVYTGVDRTIFNDCSTVAITNAAIQDKAAFGGLGYERDPAYKAMGIVGSVILAASVISATVTGIRIFLNGRGCAEPINNFTYTVTDTFTGAQTTQTFDGTFSQFNDMTDSFLADPNNAAMSIDDVSYSGDGLFATASNYTTSIGTKIKLGFDAAFAILGLALAIIGFIKFKNSQAPVKLERTPIPRAIIDVRYKNGNDDGYYFNYYAAKLATTGDNDYKTEEDTMKLYGDLNGLSEEDPWLVLYYARDMRLGSPLTVNALFKQNSATLNILQKSYVPVHKFVSTELVMNSDNYAAFNLNTTNGKSNAPALYLFFQRDKSVVLNTASITDEGALAGSIFNWTSLVYFAVGAGLASVCTAIVMKRKIKKQQPVEA